MSTIPGPAREQRPPEVIRITDQLETPSIDDRKYRVIELPNKLEVLLVHDADTDKASAAMDVNVGNFSDPEDMPGLAHCVEHMLFMGTEKYPVENAYGAYLSANSGYSNAYTAATSTNYYFEIAAKPSDTLKGTEEERSPFFGALDRFAQFFIAPLFLNSTLDRELRAVDSENKKNLQSDLWRLHQLEKSTANPGHPYCHFSTGSLETLKIEPEARGVDVQTEFMKFHEQYYSANRMKLVILGRESLDTLERWTADLFAGVKNKNLAQNRWITAAPIAQEQLCTQIFAKSVMELRQVSLSFPSIDEELLYESQPNRYISHLLGHEGPGSVMSYLKKKGLAESLSSGAEQIAPGSGSILNVTVRLTEDGLKNYKEVVNVIFQYISLIKEFPPQQWIFEEQQGLAAVNFKFKEKSPASSFTSSTSAAMQIAVPREMLLSSPRLLRKFDAALITKGLSYLRPDNFRMTVVNQNFPGDWDKKEKWYGTEYKLETIPADFLAELTAAANSTTKDRLPELYLPHKNEFIPTNLEVEKKEIAKPSLAPKLIRNDENARVWYKKDDTFWVPKANLYLQIRNNLNAATPSNSVKSRVYTDMVNDALEEYAYDAELAGLGFAVHSGPTAITVTVSGYNDKLAVLLEKVLITMRDLPVEEERFEIVREKLLRAMRNWDFEQPYNRVGSYTSYLTSDNSFMNDHYLPEIPLLTPHDIREHYPRLLQQTHIDLIVHGNMYKEDALKVAKLVESTLKPRPLPKVEWPVKRSLIFPSGSSYVYNHTLRDPKNVNHCIEYTLWLGSRADREIRARALLLEQITHEPAFDQLRTKEQLGYVVFSGTRQGATTIGYRIIIQSEKPNAYLESRIDSFLSGFAETLRAMSDAEFEGHKQAQINKRLEKLKNLGQESQRLYTHVESEFFDFELVNHDAAHIKVLTKADMLTFYDTFILPSSPSRAKLSVHLNAQAKAESASTAATTATALVEKGLNLLNLKKDDAAAEKEETSTEAATAPPTPTVSISDVRAFKATLPLSAGPRAVKDLSEFEDHDAKL